MTTKQITQILDELHMLHRKYLSATEARISNQYDFEVLPAIPWDKQSVEKEFRVTIPPDLETLWDHASSLYLFVLRSSPAPTGLMFVSPLDLALVQQEAKTVAFPHDLHLTDLVVGVHRVLYDFRLVVRCDPRQDDFGFVFVTQEMDRRSEWKYAATSVGEFLSHYLQYQGREYWQTEDLPYVRL